MSSLPFKNVHEFMQAAIQLKERQQQLRLGQAMYIVLYMHDADLAREINATDLDPFYLNCRADDQIKWDKFVAFVSEHVLFGYINNELETNS